jgi:hypothetical protein
MRSLLFDLNAHLKVTTVLIMNGAAFSPPFPSFFPFLLSPLFGKLAFRSAKAPRRPEHFDKKN